MAKEKKKVGLQNRLDIISRVLKDYQWEGGEIVLNFLYGNNETTRPDEVVIKLPHVRIKRIPNGDKLILAEYATSDATNGGEHD